MKGTPYPWTSQQVKISLRAECCIGCHDVRDGGHIYSITWYCDGIIDSGYLSREAAEESAWRHMTRYPDKYLRGIRPGQSFMEPKGEL